MPLESEQTPHNPRIKMVIAPERSAGVSASTPEPGKTPEKKPRKFVYGTVAGIAGAAIAAGAIMGIGALNEKPKKDDHASSASAAPSKTPEASTPPTPEALTVQSLEIPAGLTPEELGTTLIDRLSSWDMAGATAENRDGYLKAGAATGDSFGYATQLAQQNGAIYAEALFGPDWQSVPTLATYVPNKEKANAGLIELWFATSAGISRLDPEPFKSSDTVDSVTVVSQSGGAITERIATTAHNNSSANRADTLAPGTAALDGEKFVVVATFTTVNGVEKVSGFDIVKP